MPSKINMNMCTVWWASSTVFHNMFFHVRGNLSSYCCNQWKECCVIITFAERGKVGNHNHCFYYKIVLAIIDYYIYWYVLFNFIWKVLLYILSVPIYTFCIFTSNISVIRFTVFYFVTDHLARDNVIYVYFVYYWPTLCKCWF